MPAAIGGEQFLGRLAVRAEQPDPQRQTQACFAQILPARFDGARETPGRGGHLPGLSFGRMTINSSPPMRATKSTVRHSAVDNLPHRIRQDMPQRTDILGNLARQASARQFPPPEVSSKLDSMFKPLLWAPGCLLACSLAVSGQDNYEIQVYPGQVVDRGATMFETHSNFTFTGAKTTEDGTYPTHHAFHETIEITRGITPWFETGFYIFTSANPGHGWQWVGDHIRPRVAVPESLKWPVGLSLSAEFGYQRRHYSVDSWTLELRPVIDKTIGPVYLAFNPTFDRSFKGLSENDGWVFSPNFKFGYQFNKKVNGGLEYYGSLGPVSNFNPIHDQQQQILPAFDLDLSPRWEVNFGLGVGITSATDHLLVKAIVGYRFGKIQP